MLSFYVINTPPSQSVILDFYELSFDILPFEITIIEEGNEYCVSIERVFDVYE